MNLKEGAASPQLPRSARKPRAETVDAGRPTTIARTLGDRENERLYRDLEPQWLQGRAKRPCKTSAEASAERELLAKALLRQGGRRALALADDLNWCRPRSRCLSGACPECGRAAQRLLVRATRNIFRSNQEGAAFVHVVARRAAVKPGELNGDNIFDLTTRRLHRALDDVRVPAFGGLDISFNEHEKSDFKPRWFPHAHIFAPDRALRRREDRFRAWFLGDERTPHALRIEDFDGERGGIAYAFKPDFDRRVTLLPQIRDDGSRNPYGTRSKSIWKRPRVELALALHGAGLDSRIFFHGYRLIETSDDFEIVRAR